MIVPFPITKYSHNMVNLFCIMKLRVADTYIFLSVNRLKKCAKSLSLPPLKMYSKDKTSTRS